MYSNKNYSYHQEDASTLEFTTICNVTTATARQNRHPRLELLVPFIVAWNELQITVISWGQN